MPCLSQEVRHLYKVVHRWSSEGWVVGHWSILASCSVSPSFWSVCLSHAYMTPCSSSVYSYWCRIYTYNTQWSSSFACLFAVSSIMTIGVLLCNVAWEERGIVQKSLSWVCTCLVCKVWSWHCRWLTAVLVKIYDKHLVASVCNQGPFAWEVCVIWGLLVYFNLFPRTRKKAAVRGRQLQCTTLCGSSRPFKRNMCD